MNFDNSEGYHNFGNFRSQLVCTITTILSRYLSFIPWGAKDGPLGHLKVKKEDLTYLLHSLVSTGQDNLKVPEQWVSWDTRSLGSFIHRWIRGWRENTFLGTPCACIGGSFIFSTRVSCWKLSVQEPDCRVHEDLPPHPTDSRCKSQFPGLGKLGCTQM